MDMQVPLIDSEGSNNKTSGFQLQGIYVKGTGFLPGPNSPCVLPLTHSPQPLVLLLWSNLGLVWLLSDHSVWTFDRSTLEVLPTIFAQGKHSFVPLAHWRGAGRTAFTDEVSFLIICDTVLTDAFFSWIRCLQDWKSWDIFPLSKNSFISKELFTKARYFMHYAGCNTDFFQLTTKRKCCSNQTVESLSLKIPSWVILYRLEK